MQLQITAVRVGFSAWAAVLLLACCLLKHCISSYFKIYFMLAQAHRGLARILYCVWIILMNCFYGPDMILMYFENVLVNLLTSCKISCVSVIILCVQSLLLCPNAAVFGL